MTRQTDLDMRAVEFRADGSPVRYEVVHQPQAQLPRVIGDDDAPIVAPVQPDRVPRVQYIVTGSPVDEAVGFNRRVYPLALVVGVLAVTMALIFGASLSLWLGLLYFGTAFGLTWLLAFLWDTARSPGGVELVNTLHLWRFLAREQRFRHSRYSASTSTAPAWLGPVLLAGAVGFTVLFLAVIIIGVAAENMPR